MKISVACICQDEEETIGWMLRACESIEPYLDAVIIVDGGSKDGTIDIIIDYWRSGFPVRLLHRPFDNFCNQKNFALDQCKGDWIVLADADMTWGKNLAWELERGLMGNATCIDVPLFYTVKDAHHYRNDMEIGGSTRIIRNVGCRYVQPVHEYLVWPGEEDPKDRMVTFPFPQRRPDWDSIRQLPRLSAYGQIPFFEHTWRKSDKALRDKARRYKRFAYLSTQVGAYMDDDEDYLVRERERILAEHLYAPLPLGRDRYVVKGT